MRAIVPHVPLRFTRGYVYIVCIRRLARGFLEWANLGARSQIGRLVPLNLLQFARALGEKTWFAPLNADETRPVSPRRRTE